MRWGISVAVVLGSISIARADETRGGESAEVQAMLDCAVGGKALSPQKANTIAGHVACAIVLDGWSLEGLSAEAWITQAGADGDRHAATAVPGGEDSEDVLRFDPFVRGDEVRACKDFVVHARLALEGEVVWSTDLAVRTKCKKPKKVSAKLACSFVASDGSIYTWPGNGAKQKPRVDDTLACWVTGPKSGASLLATIAGHEEWMWQDDETGAWSSGQMLDAGLDFTPCDPFTVTASIANSDGQAVWSGKQKIAQRCD